MSGMPEGVSAPDSRPGVDPPAVAALAEPTQKVGAAYLVTITLANIGILMVLLGALNALLPRYAEAVAGADAKEVALAWISAIGAIAAMVFNPLAGALSDRTTSRFGRRRPWVVLGVVLGAVTMVLLSFQTSVVGVAIVWFLVLGFSNMAFSALMAYVPDQAPVEQRGYVSGLFALAQVVGLVVGVQLVAYVVRDLRYGSWLLGALMVLLALPLLVLVHDARLPREYVKPFDFGAFLRGFWVSPRKYPDFGWAFITRFLIWLGTAMVTIYLLYYLADFLHHPDPPQGQATLILLFSVGIVATAIVGGRWSDRSGRRKVYVIVSSLVMGAAVLILAFVHNLTGAMVGAFLLGLGYGVYLAVDQALITQVLPTAEDRARDLGVINIANTMPQIMAPAIAGPLVTSLGGYPSLYIATAVVMVVAGYLVRFIKSVP